MSTPDPFAFGGRQDADDEIIVDEDAKEALALLVGEPALGPLARELFDVEEELGNLKFDSPGYEERQKVLSRRLSEILHQIEACPVATVGGLAWHLREALAVVDFSEDVHPGTEAALRAVFERAKALARQPGAGVG